MLIDFEAGPDQAKAMALSATQLTVSTTRTLGGSSGRWTENMLAMTSTTGAATLYSTLSPADSVEPEVKMSLYVLLVAVTVIGVVGNVMTITSVATSRKLQTVPNVYVVNLAIADLAICALSAPFSIYTLMESNQVLELGDLCKFMGALTLLCLIMTIVNLTLIAVNRYVLLVRGSKLYVRLFTRRNVVISVVGVYSMAVLGILPPLVGFGQMGYNYKMGICIFIASDVSTYWYVQGILHILIAGPCIFLTVFCYVRILMHFRAAEQRIVEQAYGCGGSSSAVSPSAATRASSTNGGSPRAIYTAGPTASSDHDSSHIEDCELSSSATAPANGSSAVTTKSYEASYTSVRHKRSRASRRVTFNLLTVFLIFLICWLPIIIIFTVDYYNQFPAVISHYAIMLAMANSCLNVFIYAGMNRGFRKTYWYLLSFQCSKLRTDLS